MHFRNVLLFAASVAGFGSSQHPPAAGLSVVANSSDWKRLKAVARTPAEFNALAAYCDRRSEENALKAHECQVNLKLVVEHPTTFGRAPKWPSREDTLRQLIINYRNASSKWKTLAAEYRQRAGK